MKILSLIIISMMKISGYMENKMGRKKQKNKKNYLGVGLIIIILCLAIFAYFLSKPKYSTNEFYEVIKKDEEVKEFIDSLQKKGKSEVEITKTELTRKDILIEQYGPYKNEYKDLPLDREEIYKVKLITEKREMVAIVDMQSKEVLSSYGILNIRIQ